MPHVRLLVLDEADLVLGSFRSDVERILAGLEAVSQEATRPQTVFCAATMPDIGARSAGEWLRMRFPAAVHAQTPRLHMSAAGIRVNNMFVDTDVLREQSVESGIPLEMLVADARHSALLKALRMVNLHEPADYDLDGADGFESDVDALELDDFTFDGGGDGGGGGGTGGIGRGGRDGKRRLVVIDEGVDEDASGAGECAPCKALVFANSAISAEAAFLFLETAAPDLRCEVLHKHVPAAERADIAAEFVDPHGPVQVLISTDVAARGLDTTGVGHVIQLECAIDLVSHLHRVGRTARAGRTGVVTNISTTEDKAVVERLQHEASAGVDDSITRRHNAHQKSQRLARERKKFEGDRW